MARGLRMAAAVLVMGVAAGAGAGARQVSVQNGVPMPSQTTSEPKIPGINDDSPASNPMRGRMQEAAIKAHEDDRRKRLRADTERLVLLSNQLKEEVDKTAKDELSVTVVKKAAEIEKLAHDVRQRMVN